MELLALVRGIEMFVSTESGFTPASTAALTATLSAVVTGPRQLAAIEPSVGHAGGGGKSEENVRGDELG